MLIGLAGGVVAVVALSTVLVVLSTSKSAEATVVDSVQSTLGDHSAHVNLTLDVSTAGTQVTGTGSGVIDFTKNAAQLHMDVRAAGQQLGLDEVVVGKVVYVDVAAAGASLSQLYPGKSWLSLDLGSLQSAAGQSPSAFGSDSNPAAMLRLLAQQGNTVVSLGPSTVDGVSVNGYSVTFDPAKISAELQNANLPSWIRQATSGVDFGHLTMTVYIDGSGMVRRWTTKATASAAGNTVDTSETLDFSDFGTPVNVTAPPASEVLPLDQLMPGATSPASGL